MVARSLARGMYVLYGCPMENALMLAAGNPIGRHRKILHVANCVTDYHRLVITRARCLTDHRLALTYGPGVMDRLFWRGQIHRRVSHRGGCCGAVINTSIVFLVRGLVGVDLLLRCTRI